MYPLSSSGWYSRATRNCLAMERPVGTPALERGFRGCCPAPATASGYHCNTIDRPSNMVVGADTDHGVVGVINNRSPALQSLRDLSPFILLVSQLWFKSCFPNSILYCFISEAVRGTCSTYYIFFNHDRTKIIGTGMQANLGSLFSNRKPAEPVYFLCWVT